MRLKTRNSRTGAHRPNRVKQLKRVEALAAIREAECIFTHERTRGETTFRVEPDKLIERLEQFDPQAMQIIMVPRVVGG